jgi:hypothetical protein
MQVCSDICIAISGKGLGFLEKLHWMCFELRFMSNLYGSGAGNVYDNGYHIQNFVFKYIIILYICVGDTFHSLIDFIPWKGCIEPVV